MEGVAVGRLAVAPFAAERPARVFVAYSQAASVPIALAPKLVDQAFAAELAKVAAAMMPSMLEMVVVLRAVPEVLQSVDATLRLVSGELSAAVGTCLEHEELLVVAVQCPVIAALRSVSVLLILAPHTGPVDPLRKVSDSLEVLAKQSTDFAAELRLGCSAVQAPRDWTAALALASVIVEAACCRRNQARPAAYLTE